MFNDNSTNLARCTGGTCGGRDLLSGEGGLVIQNVGNNNFLIVEFKNCSHEINYA